MKYQTVYPDTIQLGILAPTLEQQFSHLLTSEEAKKALHNLQLDNEAISRIKIRGLLIESASYRAQDKLLKKVIDLLVKYGVARRS
jgi:hypothetical protein